MPVGPYPDFSSCVAAQMKIYREKHPDWTEEHLKEVAGGVCYKIEQQTQGSVGFSYVRPFKHESRQGSLIAEIDVIEHGVNLNQWGVTDESRRRAAESLKHAILLGPSDKDHPGTIFGGPPGAPHEGMWYPIQGKFMETYSNGVTGGKAQIQDPYAEEKIENGEWVAVSPSVHGLAHYDQQGNVIFDDFQFQHVLFLPKDMPPAYPNMGIKDLEKQGSFEAALQAALQPFTVTAPGAKTDAEMKALGIHPEKKSNKEEIEMSQTINISPDTKDLKIQELDKTVKELQAKLEENKSAIQKLAELEAKTKALETFQGAVSKREHSTLVSTVLETEKQAGLLADDKAKEEESKRLDGLGDDTLRELQAVYAKTAAYVKSLPPAKKPEEFDEKAQAAADDAWNTEHRRLFGHGHDKDGKEVA